MARRRGGVGWLVVFLVVVLASGILNSRPNRPPTADNDVSVVPLVSSPNKTSATQQLLRSTTPETILYVTADSLNVRDTPSTTGKLLLSAPRGTAVSAVSKSGDWVEVRLNNGQTAWMNGAYLSTARPQLQQQQVQSETPPAPPPAKRQVDRNAAIQAIIAESIASYPGNCPCPYNTDRAGHSCGRRSAWSKAGGYAPLCYANDVSPAMIESYLARN